MQILLDSSDYATVGIHGVDRDLLTATLKQTGAKLVDITGFWVINVPIGSVTISLYSTKEKCVCCKKADVDDPTVDFCGSCYEELEEREAEERARQKREDAYDASRGH